MTARHLRVGVSVLAAAATLSAAAVVLDAGSAVAAAPTSTAHTSWFHDPVSAKARRAEAPLRGHHWGGRLRHTTATYRTHDGRLAVPARWAVGHTLQRGDALVLDGDALFTFDSAHVTATARREIRGLRGAFADVRGVGSRVTPTSAPARPTSSGSAPPAPGRSADCSCTSTRTSARGPSATAASGRWSSAARRAGEPRTDG